MRGQRHSTDLNYWPAVADVFLAAFLLAIFLWFAHNLLSTLKLDEKAGENGALQVENAQLRSQLKEAKSKIAKLEELIERQESETKKLAAENAHLKKKVAELNEQLAKARALSPPEGMSGALATIAQLEQRVKELLAQIDKLKLDSEAQRTENAKLKDKLASALNDKPPIIDLTDRANFKFETGKATITSAFLEAFNRSADLQRIPEIVTRYNVNLIEIIGHTDAVPASNKESNLDYKLGVVLTSTSASAREVEMTQLRYGSNVDLGLIRAIAVRSLIQGKLSAWGLPDVEIRCYSAGQGVLPLGESKDATDYSSKEKPDDTRRRIEIRFTRKESP